MCRAFSSLSPLGGRFDELIVFKFILESKEGKSRSEAVNLNVKSGDELTRLDCQVLWILSGSTLDGLLVACSILFFNL